MLAWLLVCQRQSEKGKHCYSPTEAGGCQWTYTKNKPEHSSLRDSSSEYEINCILDF